MSFLKAYLPGPVVDVLLPGLVLLILLYLIVPRIVQKLKDSGAWDRVMDRFGGERLRILQFEREIAALKKGGNHLAAAELYEEAEWYPEALTAYLEGEEYVRAGLLYEKLAEQERASEMYIRAGDWKRAANLFAGHGRPEKAAELYAQHGQKIDAAKLYFESKQYSRAGELYEAVQYHPQAAQAFEKLGEHLRAAENYEKHWASTSTMSGSGLLASGSDREAKTARLAGQLYEKGGEPERAANVYARAGLTLDAAALAARTGRFQEAGEMLLREEKLAEAADMFERANQIERASLLRGEVAFRGGDSARAAAEFFAGRDYLRAAEIFESVGDLASAAECFEKSESPIQAANVYLRAGKKKEAAAMFEQGQDYETAAKLFSDVPGAEGKAALLFEKANRFFDAGKCSHAQGDVEQAIKLLQHVEPGDENYDEASLILSRLFIQKNMAGLAADKLKRLLGNRGVSQATLPHFYSLALAYEQLGQRDDAIETFKKILAERYGYEDVEVRLTRLTRPDARAPSSPPASPQGAPAPSAQATPGPAVSRSGTAAAVAAASPATSPYRLVQPASLIGDGSLGKVFRGVDTRTGMKVAIKLLKREILSNRARVQSFVAEAKKANQLEHPNLIRLLALTDLNGEKAVVMEHSEGVRLSTVLTRVGRLNAKQARDLLVSLSAVLGLAHAQGIVHRAIKMSRVLVEPGGKLRLIGIGFGPLRGLAPGSEDSSYLPKDDRADASADLFALGGMVSHGLTGVHPRKAGAREALAALTPAPRPLVDLLLRSIAEDPPARFQNAAELEAAVRAIR